MIEKSITLPDGYYIVIRFDASDNTAQVRWQSKEGENGYVYHRAGWFLQYSEWWPMARLPEAIALAIQAITVHKTRQLEFHEQCTAAEAEAREIVNVWKELEA